VGTWPGRTPGGLRVTLGASRPGMRGFWQAALGRTHGWHAGDSPRRRRTGIIIQGHSQVTARVPGPLSGIGSQGTRDAAGGRGRDERGVENAIAPLAPRAAAAGSARTPSMPLAEENRA
jgi:hypothetical protein